MANVPVVCDNCGALFIMPNLIGGSGGGQITMVGNSAGPCPACGGMGHIPDGTYRLENDTLTFLQGPERTREELSRFAEILQTVVTGESTVEEAQDTVRVEIPELAPLTNELAKTRNANWQQFWIKVILTVISILFASQSANFEDVEINLEDAINITVEQESANPER